MTLYVYTDGASRGNPGESASGYLILDYRDRQLAKRVFYNGTCTNNVAEYKAIVAALKKAVSIRHEGEQLVLHSDSELVVNQLSGRYRVKDAGLRKLNLEAKRLLKRFGSYELLAVRRENRHVSAVDKELNLFLDKNKLGEMHK
ncbi:MAG: ribonuclease HI family protein [Candidatus Micrarchaeota archaeon]|nr:ribonuclease HI family protein [Candidatus Micrarchaeota archaeon]